MIKVSMLRANGLTDEQIVNILIAAENERAASLRERKRINQQNHRSRHRVTGDSGDSSHLKTPPDTDIMDISAPVSLQRRTAAPRKPLTWSFDDFWRQYPHKVGKADARKSFERVERSGAVKLEDLMLGIMRYAAKTDDRPWCNPATWLNQGRWEDQPAMLNGGHNERTKTAGDRAREIVASLRENEVDPSGFGRPLKSVGGA